MPGFKRRRSSAPVYGRRVRRRAAQTRKARRPVRRTRPSRLTGSTRKYRQKRMVANMISSIAESKFQGARQDCLETVAKPAGTVRPMSYIFVNTGADMSAAHAEYTTPLNLFQFVKGDANDERIGNYMYLKKSHLKFNIQCLPIDTTSASGLDISLNTPIDCRLMVVKANRKLNKLNKSPDPGGSLFIDTQNGEFGYDETSGSINLLMSQPINKRKWLVYKDYKFTLAPPTMSLTSENHNLWAPTRHPSKFQRSLDLPLYKKTHFEDASNTPDDQDTQWLVILQCVRQCHCFQQGTAALRPSNIRMEVLGTTSALDN